MKTYHVLIPLADAISGGYEPKKGDILLFQKESDNLGYTFFSHVTTECRVVYAFTLASLQRKRVYDAPIDSFSVKINVTFTADVIKRLTCMQTFADDAPDLWEAIQQLTNDLSQ